jgi:co-chaperonin GroES (HSP10)
LTTESGLILSSSDEADKAKVVAVGSDVVDVQVNDVLLINWKKAQKLDGETYRVSVEEVIAVLED